MANILLGRDTAYKIHDKQLSSIKSCTADNYGTGGRVQGPTRLPPDIARLSLACKGVSCIVAKRWLSTPHGSIYKRVCLYASCCTSYTLCSVILVSAVRQIKL